METLSVFESQVKTQIAHERPTKAYTQPSKASVFLIFLFRKLSSRKNHAELLLVKSSLVLNALLVSN